MSDHESWQCQGRQEHGWFGHGTCGDDLELAEARPSGATLPIRGIVDGAVGALASHRDRQRYEAWLNAGGRARLVRLMTQWTQVGNLDRDAFRRVFLRLGGNAMVIDGLSVALEGDSNLALASGRLARTYLAIGPYNWSRFVADAERVTSAVVGNIRDLAAVVVSEAGDARLPEHARIAVGSVVMNRMSRSTTNDVRRVWGQFGHKATPKIEHLKLALRLLSGGIPDPTLGATHFYSPSAMPRDGDNPGNRDIGGGLESVPGVMDQRNEPVLNYRPGFAKHFDEVFVPSVPAASFKFFRAPGHGPVR